MAEQAHWLHVMHHDIYRCPKCGTMLQYGARRSLLSLIPGVCRHVFCHLDGYVERGGKTDGLAFIIADLPVKPSEEGGIKGWLRARLSDEIKGNRRFWWWRYTKEVRDSKKAFRAAMERGIRKSRGE